MKNKILIFLMVCGIMIVGSGCGKDKINGVAQSGDNHRFVETGTVFYVAGENLKVIEDTETNILYLYGTGASGAGITPWLDENGEPMKADK